MTAILVFFFAHWAISIFCQTFYLHRYSAHRMFTMSKGWERFFHILTFVGQGASFLSPRAYAILHREHHAYSDTEKDPHSPVMHKNVYSLLAATWNRYSGIRNHRIEPEARFEGGYPEFPLLDRFGHRTWLGFAFGTAYTVFYLAFAPHPAWLLLLPIHYLMGPIHGTIVNWCGHMYGYRNFATKDHSRNTLPFDFVTWGELFQNNHHTYGMSPNFAARWFELDPTYQVMKLMHWVGIIDMSRSQKMRWTPSDKIEEVTPGPIFATTEMAPTMRDAAADEDGGFAPIALSPSDAE